MNDRLKTRRRLLGERMVKLAYTVAISAARPNLTEDTLQVNRTQLTDHDASKWCSCLSLSRGSRLLLSNLCEGVSIERLELRPEDWRKG